jgi:hypothetical protein
MRKSEADLVLKYLREHYEGPLSLQVVNLASLGFQLPGGEPPYFVVGQEPTDEEGEDKDTLQREREVVVWDQRSSGWTVRHLREWEINRAGQRGRELYIYDTRNREFVPPEKFHIPEEPI